jgi:N-formylglutamate amidohydrolase
VLRAPDPAHEEQLLARYFRPYATAMTALVDDRLAATGRAVVIDVHSYPARALPYELHGDGPRPAICLGTDPDHTPEPLTTAARKAFAGLGEVRLNTPFAGCYVPLKHYRRRTAVSSLMVEIRRDLYLADPGGPPRGDRVRELSEALARLVDAASAP